MTKISIQNDNTGMKPKEIKERAGLSWRNIMMKTDFYAAIVRKMKPVERKLSKELVLNLLPFHC